MKSSTTIKQAAVLGFVLTAICAFLMGCVYDFPITEKPTRPIDSRLLGNWTSPDGKSKMKVVKLDDRNYIVALDGDLYRVYHSDFDKIPLVTAQDLSADSPKYCFCSWKLGDDGLLMLRLVNDKLIPDDTKTSREVRKLLKANLQSPDLFAEGQPMIRDK
jgi:hypothetical protein